MAFAEPQPLDPTPAQGKLELRPIMGATAMEVRWRVMEGLLWLMPLILVMRKTIFLRRRSMEDFGVVDNAAAAQIAVVLGCAVFVFFSGRIGMMWRRLRLSAAGAILAYYGLGAISAAWSVNPSFSLYRAFEVIVQFGAIFIALSYSRDFARAENRVLVISALTTVLGMSAVIRANGLTVKLGAWHTNSYSTSGVMLFCYVAGEYMTGRRDNLRNFKWAGGVGLFATLIGTSSASNLAMLLGLAVAAMFTKYKDRVVVLLILGGLLLAATGGPSNLKHMIFYGKSEKSLSKMTGRVAMWQSYWQDYKKRPMIGYGFAVAARISEKFKRTNTHNSFLSVMLGMGVIGLTVAVYASWRLLHEMRTTLRPVRPGAVGAVAALIAALANSLSMAFIGEGWANSTVIFVALLALFTLYIVQEQGKQGVIYLVPNEDKLPDPQSPYYSHPYLLIKK